ncbi:uncharacterized protein AB675_11231 [Cyphellophora attinorum]|uniref:Uncharacterized protein n=1 Tax=Cyphellophora attinorum TaxID=1664694 RepID=A0A0N1H927_9EURO|nr:uncharacterized protein AB675_11231 [Phialophora attinorum]KPI39892.1 hypothetical protein AB675_11231 [Phialophora attinorum]
MQRAIQEAKQRYGLSGNVQQLPQPQLVKIQQIAAHAAKQELETRRQQMQAQFQMQRAQQAAQAQAQAHGEMVDGQGGAGMDRVVGGGVRGEGEGQWDPEEAAAEFSREVSPPPVGARLFPFGRQGNAVQGVVESLEQEVEEKVKNGLELEATQERST